MSTEKKTSPDVLVIGGGAAGMMAALFSARAGARTLLIEKNEKLGRKIYITGKGRCNVTNACDTQEFMRNVPTNPRFLYSALHFFSPDDLVALLSDNGCPTKVERGNRIFPVSDKASDVTKALTAALERAGGAVRLNAQVKELIIEQQAVHGARLSSGEEIFAPRVIVATGGLSYPATGSTGDGFKFAKAAGHTLVAPLPSLIPYHTKETWPMALQGLSLKNVCLKASLCDKIIYCEQGEILFTHFGISGPLVIEMSSHIRALPLCEVTVALDMKPALSHDQLDLRLQREFAQNGKRRLTAVLRSLLPSKMAELFPTAVGLQADITAAQITAKERETLVRALKNLSLTLISPRPIAEAIVTGGGVGTVEVNAASMQSKLISGLYFAGELLDVDAHTGGFNLQIAFSTGALAGQSAAQG